METSVLLPLKEGRRMFGALQVGAVVLPLTSPKPAEPIADVVVTRRVYVASDS